MSSPPFCKPGPVSHCYSNSYKIQLVVFKATLTLKVLIRLWLCERVPKFAELLLPYTF